MIEIKKKIILAAGGTGGHLYGAISLSEELELKGYKVFLFTDKMSLGHLIRHFSLLNFFIVFSTARLTNWFIINVLSAFISKGL